jgi:hypothetical protein
LDGAFSTKETEALPVGDRVLLTEGTRALVLRGRALVVHELGGREHVIAPEVSPLGRMVEQGSVVVVPPFIVDLARGELVGRAPGAALAVATDGSVLVPAHAADATHLALGPLEWARALPPDAAPVTR